MERRTVVSDDNDDAAAATVNPIEDIELVQLPEFSVLSGPPPSNPPRAAFPSSIIDVYDDDSNEEGDYLDEVRELVMSPLKKSESSDERYSKLLHIAQNEDFTELRKINFLYKTRGFDNAGHNMIVVIEDNLIPYLGIVKPEQILLYLMYVLDVAVTRTYVIMYVPSSNSNSVLFSTNMSSLEKASVYDPIAGCYSLISTAVNNIFPRIYSRNIRRFYVFLNKSVSLFKFRMYVWYYFYYTFSSRFWNMIEYVTNIRRIFMYAPPIYFQLPTRVFAQLSGMAPVFGMPISSVPTKSIDGIDDSEYPNVVFDCLMVLNHSTTHSGILSCKAKKDYNSKSSVRGYEDEDAFATLGDIITEYNFHGSPNLARIEDSTIVANLLRTYLADLPEPLIPNAVMDELVDLRSKEALTAEKVCESLDGINPLCKRVVRGVLWFLVKVLRNKKYSCASVNDVVNYMFHVMVKGYEFNGVAPILKFIFEQNECVLSGFSPIERMD